jgi:hypothetical protein
METKEFVWRGVEPNTTEYTVVTRNGIDHLVNGKITGEADGSALNVQYNLRIDNDWVIQSVDIHVNNKQPFSWSFEKDNEGRWQDNHGSMLPELDECIDIDIAMTPFTNTLPVNRLRLQKGQSKEITVLYFLLPDNEFKPARQRYTSFGNGSYQYEGLPVLKRLYRWIRMGM